MSYLDLFGFLGKLIGGVSDVKAFADQMGSVQDEIFVTVYGGPNSDRKRLYRLAASIGFGLVQRLGPTDGDIPAPGMVGIEYDAADNYVTFSLRYSNTLAVIMATSTITGQKSATELYDELPVLSGPAPQVRGGEWNFTGPGIGNFNPVVIDKFPVPDYGPDLARRVLLTKSPLSVPPDPDLPPPPKAPVPPLGPLARLGLGLPGAIIGTLADYDRLHLPPDPATPKPTVNPRPHADARTRGSWTSLVFSALTTPATTFDLTYPSPPDTLERFAGK